ncbi:MAG: hypothetical protein CME33_04175 [Gimesia sp.]|nr:hypothetical protein [Gimesia sp.]
MGKAGYTLCTPLSFILIEELSNRLRHAEKLMQIESRKNRRCNISAGMIAQNYNRYNLPFLIQLSLTSDG